MAQQPKPVNEESKQRQEARQNFRNAVLDKYTASNDILPGTIAGREFFKESVANNVTNIVKDVAQEFVKYYQHKFRNVWVAFPADRYVQPGDQKSAQPSKRAPRVAQRSALPSRGVAQELLETVEPDVHNETDTDAAGLDGTQPDEQCAETTTTTKDSRKHIVRINMPAKQALHFLFMRYCTELYISKADLYTAIDNQKTIDTLQAFDALGDYGPELNLIVNRDSQPKRLYTSSVVKHVLAVGEQLGAYVDNQARNVNSDHLKEYLRILFKDDNTFVEHAANRFLTFLKLVGMGVATEIWADEHASINEDMVSAVILHQVFGQDPNVVCDTSFLATMRTFVNDLNPPMTEEQKQARQKARKDKQQPVAEQPVSAAAPVAQEVPIQTAQEVPVVYEQPVAVAAATLPPPTRPLPKLRGLGKPAAKTAA
jgi:hypothetical protein